jgi:hypothetical protein
VHSDRPFGRGVLKAVDRAGPPPQRRHAPRSTPPGFRRVQRRLSVFWKIARIRAPRGASLADRLARLLAVLARPGRYIARFLKELCKGLRLSRLIPLAPPAQTLAVDAPRATVRRQLVIAFVSFEPPRVCRRVQFLRGWTDEQPENKTARFQGAA